MSRLSDAELVRILYRATGLIAPVLDVLERGDPFRSGDEFDPATTDPATTDPATTDSATTDPATTDSDADTADTDGDSFSAKAVAAAADSLGWVTNAAAVPGSPRWETMSVHERSDWWVTRVGALTTVLVAYPGVFGAAADRLPIQDVLGFTQQSFVLCGIARVHGVTDRRRQTDLIAQVLCDRTVDSATVSDVDAATDVDATEEPAADGPTPPRDTSSWSPRDVVRRIWTTAKVLRSVVGETRRRPAPSKVWRTLSAVPVVGAAADYVGERSALRHAADAAIEWLDRADDVRP